MLNNPGEHSAASDFNATLHGYVTIPTSGNILMRPLLQPYYSSTPPHHQVSLAIITVSPAMLSSLHKPTIHPCHYRSPTVPGTHPLSAYCSIQFNNSYTINNNAEGQAKLPLQTKPSALLLVGSSDTLSQFQRSTKY